MAPFSLQSWKVVIVSPGAPIVIRDYVEVDVNIMGCPMRRPFLVVDGLENHKCVLGCNFLKIFGEMKEDKPDPPRGAVMPILEANWQAL